MGFLLTNKHNWPGAPSCREQNADFTMEKWWVNKLAPNQMEFYHIVIAIFETHTQFKTFYNGNECKTWQYVLPYCFTIIALDGVCLIAIFDQMLCFGTLEHFSADFMRFVHTVMAQNTS